MAASDSPIALAVFYRGDHTIPQLAALQTLGIRLEFIPVGSEWTLRSRVSGVLWELELADRAERLVAALVASAPAASFGLTPQPAIAELSRALGFRAHLLPPFSLTAIEGALGLGENMDLADRLEALSGQIQRSAAQPDAIRSMMRAVGTATEPQHVARVLAARAAEWIPLDEWYVFAVEPDGVPHLLADPPVGSLLGDGFGGAGGRRRDRAHWAVAVCVTNHLDERINPEGGASEHARGVGRSAGRSWSTTPSSVSSSASIVDEPVASLSSRPASNDAVVRLLEPAAYAMSNALRLARAEALSVTDDLTQLFNSRYLHDALRKETKRAMRSGWPLSLLFIDLDGFKKINDAHGHLLGSRALDRSGRT